MKRLLPAMALLLSALLVHLAFGRPAERQAIRAREDAARLRKDKRAIAARLLRLDPDPGLGNRATRTDPPAEASVDGVTRLRLSLLDALAGQPVSGVRLSVVPARPPLAAEGRVRAVGAFADLVRLSGRLVGPGRGFVLRRVRFATATPQDGGLVLEVEGFSVSSPRAEPGADPKADPLPPPPARDPFRYAEAPSAPALRAKVGTAATAVAPAVPVLPPPALRFVGFVRRPEGLRAALATASGVVVVGPGDVVLGHTVLALDEDRGLRLRAPDSTELTLRPER